MVFQYDKLNFVRGVGLDIYVSYYGRFFIIGVNFGGLEVNRVVYISVGLDIWSQKFSTRMRKLWNTHHNEGV